MPFYIPFAEKNSCGKMLELKIASLCPDSWQWGWVSHKESLQNGQCPPRRLKLRRLSPPALAAVIQTDRQVVQYTSRYSKERRLNLRRRGVCCPTCLFCKDTYSLGDTVRVVGTMQADRSGHSLFFPCFRAVSKILPNSRIAGNR